MNEAPADMLQPAGQVGAQWSKEASCQAQLPGPGRFTQRRALGFQSHQSTGRALAQPLPFTALLHFASLLYVRWRPFGGLDRLDSAKNRFKRYFKEEGVRM